MDQTDAAGILLDELDRVLAAAVDPVAVQLKAQSRSICADDVQQELAVVTNELYVMVVVVQVNAVFLQLQSILICFLGEIHSLLVVAHAGHGQHADAQHIAVQLTAVLNDLLIVVGIAQELAGHTGQHGRGGCGAGRDIQAQLVDSLAEACNVLSGHGDLRDLNAVIADISQLAHALVCVKVRHLCGGNGAHLNTDQTFVCHGSFLLLSVFCGHGATGWPALLLAWMASISRILISASLTWM